jgi:uncharacterized protein (TIGR00369 family)
MTEPLKHTCLFGEKPVHVEEGLTRWQYVVKREHFNPGGSLHGGVVATILDSCMGHSVRTVRPPESLHAAIDLNVKFLQPTLKDGITLTFEGRVVHKGKRVVFAEGVASDEDGRVLARSTSSYAIIVKK